MSAPTHPGQIVFVDADAGTEQVKPAAQVPESIAFAVVDTERVPVTKVVSNLRGAQRVIRSYGADGQLLRSTIQAPPKG